MVKIIILSFFPVLIYGQLKFNFNHLVEKGLYNSREIHLTILQKNIEEKEGHLRRLKWKPSLNFTTNLPNWNRTLNPIILPSGTEDFVYRASAFSQWSLNGTIPIPNGGRITLQSNLQRLDVPNINSKKLSTEYAFAPFSIGLEYPILNFNQKKHEEEGQVIANQIADFNVKSAQYEVINALVKWYTTCILALKEMELLEESIGNYEQLISIQQEMNKKGWGNIFDNNNLNLALTQYQLQLFNLKQSFQNGKRAIADIIGVDINKWILDPTFPKIPIISKDLLKLKGTSPHNNLLLPIRQKQHQLKLENQEMRSTGKPIIGLNMLLGINKSGTSAPLSFNDWEWQQQFSIQLSIPIFNNKILQKGSEIIQLKRKNLEVQKHNMIQKNTSRQEQIWYQYQNLLKAKEVAFQTEEWATKSFLDANNLFKDGQITLIEFNNAIGQKNTASKLNLSIDCQILAIYYQLLQMLELPIETSNTR